ncbi:short chain enoyl-CoA hydratase [Acidothermus cellulolyticus 11B]|uniref:enoyl-CoA hydratase n=1 Tax=Acidothermus cellulolyticus (strain ATCC 43068 / DSM 8971 / 11B) TaxID=351607 RepID=A0LSP5_ACIC1|nr:enoyl-CoA hydratase-related protein [Acidothermus cellulolyticus]ABK52455.1 short chain enoyl-CoA hydratase [Acidothermus cellulolyticus 11B]
MTSDPAPTSTPDPAAEPPAPGTLPPAPGAFVWLEVRDSIGTIRLHRPPVNALNAVMQDQLRQAAQEAAARDDVRAVIVYGGARVFAAGADVREMAAMSRDDMAARAEPLQAAFDAVAAIPKPVIAAIAGYALGGGCELALAADLRICASDARLGQPEILLGVIPGAGGTQRLPRLIGPGRAKELIFTGRMVDADEALRIGLVNAVVPVAELYAEAWRWARTFAAGPARALAAAKRAIDGGLATSLADGLRLERTEFVELFATEDRTIGFRSFLESGPGKAHFVGR